MDANRLQRTVLCAPTMLGTTFTVQGEGEGMITDEDLGRVFIETPKRNRWMGKPLFFERIGKLDPAHEQWFLFRK